MVLEAPEYTTAKILVLGCGNKLFGDDGFGPEVVKTLLEKKFNTDEVCIMDAGTSVVEILFDIAISDTTPEKIIIIDSFDSGKPAGEILELAVEELSPTKIDDFSIHQPFTSNLLKELSEFCNIKIVIIACQVENIPKSVQPGLSKTLQAAIPKVCTLVEKHIRDGM